MAGWRFMTSYARALERVIRSSAASYVVTLTAAPAGSQKPRVVVRLPLTPGR